MTYDDQLRRALMESSLIISSFRNKNSAAGHPLREPPGVTAIITEIDALLDPEAAPKKQAPQPKFKRITIVSQSQP